MIFFFIMNKDSTEMKTFFMNQFFFSSFKHDTCTTNSKRMNFFTTFLSVLITRKTAEYTECSSSTTWVESSFPNLFSSSSLTLFWQEKNVWKSFPTWVLVAKKNTAASLSARCACYTQVHFTHNHNRSHSSLSSVSNAKIVEHE